MKAQPDGRRIIPSDMDVVFVSYFHSDHVGKSSFQQYACRCFNGGSAKSTSTGSCHPLWCTLSLIRTAFLFTSQRNNLIFRGHFVF